MIPSKIYSLILIIIILMVSVHGCVKKKILPRDHPLVRMLDVSDISSSGAVFEAEVFYNDNFEITDHGFYWGELGLSMEKVSLGSFSGTGKFTFEATRGMVEGQNVYVEAYVIAEETRIISSEMSFISEGSDPPLITSFTPVSASVGDTIIITGSNFSNRLNGCTVAFGEGLSLVVPGSTTEQVKVVVPYDLDSPSMPLSLTCNGHTVEAPNDFNLLVPELTAYSPASGRIGQEVTVTGNNFPVNPSAFHNKVYFGDERANLNTATRTSLVVTVTGHVSSASLPVRIVTTMTDYTFDENFELLPPAINSLSLTSGGAGTQLVITGEGFHNHRSYNVAKLGGEPVNVSSCNSTNLYITIPEGINLTEGDYTFTVTLFDMTSESTETFHFIPPG